MLHSLFLGNLADFVFIFLVGGRDLPREYLQGVLGLPKLRLLIGRHLDHGIDAEYAALWYALHRHKIGVNP